MLTEARILSQPAPPPPLPAPPQQQQQCAQLLHQRHCCDKLLATVHGAGHSMSLRRR